MKKVSQVLGVLALLFLLGIPATVSAKKMDILKFDKGETTGDNMGCEVSLAEEHAAKKGGVSQKCTISQDDWWVAECPPKRGVWDGYDVLKLGIFNPQKEPKSLNFVIKPHSPVAYEDRFDSAIVCRPGQNDLEIELNGACTNGGKPLVLKDRVAIWSIAGAFKKGESFYVQYFKAYTQDEVDKEDKEKEGKEEKKK